MLIPEDEPGGRAEDLAQEHALARAEDADEDLQTERAKGLGRRAGPGAAVDAGMETGRGGVAEEVNFVAGPGELLGEVTGGGMRTAERGRSDARGVKIPAGKISESELHSATSGCDAQNSRQIVRQAASRPRVNRSASMSGEACRRARKPARRAASRGRSAASSAARRM